MRAADLIRKLTILVLVVAFAAATSGEAFGYRRACEHHESALLAGSPADHGGSQHAHGGGESDAEEHDSPCGCLGTCTVSTPVPVPELRSAEGVLPAPETSFTIGPTPVVPVVQVRISHLIPFPNAPPLV